MFANGYSRHQRGAGFEQDAQIRQVQQSFVQLARQPAENMKATCQYLASLAPQQKSIQAIQEHVVKDLDSSKKQLKETQEKLKSLVARMKELDQELPSATVKYEGEGNGERLFRRTVCVLGVASGLAFATCGWGRLVGVCLAATGVSAAFWALTASETSTSKKQFTTLTAASDKHMQDIEAARMQEDQLKGHIRVIMLTVQEAAARANITVQPADKEEFSVVQTTPIAEEEVEESLPLSHYYDRRAYARSEGLTEEQEQRRKQIDFFYDLLRKQSGTRASVAADSDEESDPDEGFNIWDEN